MFKEDGFWNQGRSIGRGIDFAVGHHRAKDGQFGQKKKESRQSP